MRIILALAVLLVSSTAAAQLVCRPRVDLVARLFVEYNEVKNVEGVTSSGGILEIFSSQMPGDKGRTFTIIVTYPNGRTCIVSVGDRWRYVSDEGPSI